MSSLLDERELTEAERVAIADEPRHGVWIEEELRRDERNHPREDLRVELVRRGDGHTLTQDETDELIYFELMSLGDTSIFEAVLNAWQPAYLTFTNGRTMQQQRGGIHSDPLVRLLAFRAWGERDRQWKKRDTAKAVGAGDTTDFERWRIIYGFDGLVMYDQPDKKRELYGARRGEVDVEVEVPYGKLIADERDRGEIILDVFDQLDAKLLAGDAAPAPTGPTFVVDCG